MAPHKKSAEASDGANSVESWRYKSVGFGARFYSTLLWLAGSSASFAFFSVPRRKEWADICLDYMYVKRVQYAPTIYDPICRLLKKVPK